MNNDIAITEAKKSFFNKLNLKNKINKTKLEELDLDNIGIELNYQQVALMKLAYKNEVAYKNYQDKLLSCEDFSNNKNAIARHLLILKDLFDDVKLPDKVRSTLRRIYDETVSNNKITDEILMMTLYRLISKLSMDLQSYIYEKLSMNHQVAYEGIKEMDVDACKNMLDLLNDYTSITIKDVAGYNYYVNYNGSYNKKELENMLDFAYENGKQVRIKDLISYNNFPFYLKDCSKEVIKDKLLKYVDDITKFIANYNEVHPRRDRKLVVRSIDIVSSLITDDNPTWRGNVNNDFSWQTVLTIADLLDIIKVARNNLPNVDFVYNENKMEDANKRTHVFNLIKSIRDYEKQNGIRLINTIGLKMHVNLDLMQEDIVNMFNDLTNYNMPVAITEFDLYAPYDMITVNNESEIEILRDRFISDFYNLISNFKLSNTLKFDSVNISSISDLQNPMLTIINEERETNNLPKLKTIYGGFYTNDMKNKDSVPVRYKDLEKGSADLLYGGLIIGGLLVIIAIVCFFFMKNI